MILEEILLLFLLVLFTKAIHNKEIEVNTKTSFSAVIAIFGLSIVLFRMKLSKEFGLFTFILGSFWVLYYGSSRTVFGIKYTQGVKFLSLNGRINNYFQHIGFLLLFLVLFTEYYFSDSIIGQSSILLICLSFVLIAYNFIPHKFAIEKDFMIVFFFILSLFVVSPQAFDFLMSNLGYSKDFEAANTTLVKYFLSKPLISFLSLLGYDFHYIDDKIYYPDLEAGHISSVWIAKSCSGYYSVVIFISAFFSYILSTQEKITSVTIIWAGIGILVSYLANLFRMAIIIIAGHYWGGDALVWTHANVGWLIFTFWVFIFWMISSKVLESAKG